MEALRDDEELHLCGQRCEAHDLEARLAFERARGEARAQCYRIKKVAPLACSSKPGANNLALGIDVASG